MTVSDKKKRLISSSTPAWKVTLLVFGALVLVVQANFYFQARQARNLFTDNVREHAGLLGEVIRLNAEGAVLSGDVVREIMQTFLLNASHLIDYLDSVEAFGRDELTALAGELGLAGIRITAFDGSVREGPPGWFQDSKNSGIIRDNTVWQAPGGSLFLYQYPRFKNGHILTGLVSGRLNELQDKIGLPELFKRITGLAGIRYIRLEQGPERGAGEVSIRETEAGKVAETRLALGESTMVIGMGCDLYYGRMEENRWQWMLFSGVILLAGALSSFFLYAYQRSHLKKIRQMDRNLAREREDAALGRAAAAITHEIRNPLNAISMGLQRLSIEVDTLDEDHRALIRDLLTSVRRTDRIITDLKRFTGPLTPSLTSFPLSEVVEAALNPYRGKIDALGISLAFSRSDLGDRITADRDYCGILVDNLVKNAVEAQDDGGFIDISLEPAGEFLDFVIRNQGFAGDPARPEALLEPYVTTKTRGSGLGLAIVRRIAEAHGGGIRLVLPGPGIFEIRVRLPR